MGLDTNNVLVLRWLLLPCALTTGCSFLATNFDAESAVGHDAFTGANYTTLDSGDQMLQPCGTAAGGLLYTTCWQ